MMPWRGLGEKQPQSIPDLHYKDYANNYPIYLILNLYPLDHSSQGRAHTHPIPTPYTPHTTRLPASTATAILTA